MDAKELLTIIPSDELYNYLEYVYHHNDNTWGEVWSIDGSGSYEGIHSVSEDDVLSGLDAEAKDYNGDFPDFYWVPRMCGGNDYSGGTVHRANYLIICEEYKEEALVALLYGNYGTYAIAVSLKGLLCGSDEAKKLIETLTKLQNYPVIDEEQLSQYEAELIDQAWDSWAKDDFVKLIENKFGIELTDDDDDFRSFFEEKANEASVCWCVDGVDMYINIPRIVDSIETWEYKQ